MTLESQDADLSAPETAEADPASTWRGELANRLQAYRVKRRKVTPDAMQSRLPFAEPNSPSAVTAAPARASSPADEAPRTTYPTMVAVQEQVSAGVADDVTTGLAEAGGFAAVAERDAVENDFSFTIAIGRVARQRPADGRLMIDVSAPWKNDLRKNRDAS